MRTCLLTAFLLSTTPVLAHDGDSTPPASAAAVPAAATKAAATVDAFSAALKVGHLDEAKALLDPQVQVFESGHVEAGRDAYFAEHAAADARFLESATVTVEAREGDASGDTAWVATRSTIAREGKRYASIETMVLRRGPDGWRIVHIHWSSRELK